MKLFFGVDVTENKENEEIGGARFITETVPKDLMERIDKHDDALIENIDRKFISLPARIFKFVGGLAALLAFVLVTASIGEESFDYSSFAREFWWIFVIGLVGFAVFIALWSVERKKAKEYEESDENRAFEREGDSIDDDSRMYLGIPADAVKMDVFLGQYKIKRERIVYSDFNPINLEIDVYSEENALCFADAANKYTVLSAEIKEIRRINSSINFIIWNKDEAHNKGEYKQYKIKENNLGYTVKPYYALIIERGGEEYELQFPPYELPMIEKLTGMKAV